MASTKKIDGVCSKASEVARSALLETVPESHVGSHLEVVADGDRVASHLFESLAPGYHGWRWSVTVARAPRTKSATVDEIVMIPGPESLVAPAWVPWSDRVEPGDLGVGDVLPAAPEDPRLVPGYTGVTEDEDVAWELGLGRPRVLSALGRDEAAARWRDGDTGPHSAMAQAAPAPCATCGFLLRVGGDLGQAFGICANRFAPTDGRVVSLDHGCGAHSEAVAVPVEEEELEVAIEGVFVIGEDGSVVRSEAEVQSEVESEVQSEVQARESEEALETQEAPEPQEALEPQEVLEPQDSGSADSGSRDSGSAD